MGSVRFFPTGRLNLVLADKGWDPFPFILLNLFLSCIAALQAPIIMMSQNRQSQVDKIQNDYVSKIILRGEHQTRHVNAKMDHLITNQWRRLLEIQEIQVDLLQILQNQGQQTPNLFKDERNSRESLISLNDSDFNWNDLEKTADATVQNWALEIQDDEHSRMLLRHHFEMAEYDDNFLFSRWHDDGDNYYGMISNVKLEYEQVLKSKVVALNNRAKHAGWIESGKIPSQNTPQVLKRIVYEVVFAVGNATLDDVFAGEGVVKLRNDFDVTHMNMNGLHSKLH